MEYVGLAPEVTETGNNNRDRLNKKGREEWKAYQNFQLNDIDKENIIVPPCIIPTGSIVPRQV